MILHVVAMFPATSAAPGQGSVWSQPDQAALYAVLTAGWALALGLVLAGPARARLGAAVAVGLAVTELGFRVTDVGEVLRYRRASPSTGLWLMTAAWVFGAAGAVVAVLAVRRRARAGAGEPGLGPSLCPSRTSRWLSTPANGALRSRAGWAAQWGPEPDDAPPAPRPRSAPSRPTRPALPASPSGRRR